MDEKNEQTICFAKAGAEQVARRWLERNNRVEIFYISVVYRFPRHKRSFLTEDFRENPIQELIAWIEKMKETVFYVHITIVYEPGEEVIETFFESGVLHRATALAHGG